MTTFSIDGAQGVFNVKDKTILVTLAPSYAKSLQKLTATFTTASAVSVKIANTTQKSGVATEDFTHPVHYSVIASDGSVSIYTVTVNVNPSCSYVVNSKSNTIGVYIESADGTLSQSSITSALPNVINQITFTPSGSYAYVYADTKSNNVLSTYSVNKGTCALTLINSDVVFESLSDGSRSV